MSHFKKRWNLGNPWNLNLSVPCKTRRWCSPLWSVLAVTLRVLKLQMPTFFRSCPNARIEFPGNPVGYFKRWLHWKSFWTSMRSWAKIWKIRSLWLFFSWPAKHVCFPTVLQNYHLFSFKSFQGFQVFKCVAVCLLLLCFPAVSPRKQASKRERSTAWQEALGSRIQLIPLDSVFSLHLGSRQGLCTGAGNEKSGSTWWNSETYWIKMESLELCAAIADSSCTSFKRCLHIKSEVIEQMHKIISTSLDVFMLCWAIQKWISSLEWRPTKPGMIPQGSLFLH